MHKALHLIPGTTQTEFSRTLLHSQHLSGTNRKSGFKGILAVAQLGGHPGLLVALSQKSKQTNKKANKQTTRTESSDAELVSLTQSQGSTFSLGNNQWSSVICMILIEKDTENQMKPAQNTYYLIASSCFSLETEPSCTLETPEDFIVRTRDPRQIVICKDPLYKQPCFSGTGSLGSSKEIEV